MAENQLFLGAQLAEQTTKLTSLVDKMTQMISKQDQAIDKFTEGSDNVKFTNNTLTSVTGTTSGIGKVNTDFKCYVNGVIRIKFEIRCTGVTSPYFEVDHNGVVTAPVWLYHGTPYNGYTKPDLTLQQGVWYEDYWEVMVEEGDTLKIGHDGDSEMQNVRICYDEILKPGVNIL